MEIKLTKLPKSRVKINLEVPAKEIKPVVEKVYGELAESVEVTGFRKGKAPRAMVAERVGVGRLQQHTLEHLLQDAYGQAMHRHRLVPIASPAIGVDRFSFDELKATIEVDVLPQVSIEDYKSIKIKSPKKTEPATNSEVEKIIDHLRRQKGNLKAVKRAIQIGDWVDVGYNGQINGVIQEKLSNDHFPLIVGSKVLVPGFEEQLVGLTQGDKKTFVLEVGGKKVNFEVVIHQVQEIELSDLNEEFAKQFGHSTLEKLKNAIKISLDQEKKQQARQELESAVLDAALKKLKAELPESLIEGELDRMVSRLNEQVSQQGLTFAIYLEKIKKTPAQLRQEFHPQAVRNVRVGLLLGEVVRQEKIDPQAKEAARLALERLIEYATK